MGWNQDSGSRFRPIANCYLPTAAFQSVVNSGEFTLVKPQVKIRVHPRKSAVSSGPSQLPLTFLAFACGSFSLPVAENLIAFPQWFFAGTLQDGARPGHVGTRGSHTEEFFRTQYRNFFCDRQIEQLI
jgi:hypothetical protein